MALIYTNLEKAAQRAIEKIEEVRTRTPLILGAIYGSKDSGKTLFIKKIEDHFKAQLPVEEINVELAEQNGIRMSYITGKMPKEGIIFFPFKLNKCSRESLCGREDPANYVGEIVPRNLREEPKLDISIFIYNPRNYLHERPKGTYDLIIENHIPKKKISSRRQQELI